MMTESNYEMLAKVVAESVEKVFAAYDTALEVSEAGSVGHEVVAVIGYAADEVRGGLALGITKYLAEKTMPTPDTPTYDWAGELANQILGRVRNRMLSYKLDLQISTPVVLHGLGVQVAPPGHTGVRVASYQSGADVVQVLLEARFETGYVLPEKNEGDGAVDEGEMLLF
jgi:chemotaxis protein CheX